MKTFDEGGAEADFQIAQDKEDSALAHISEANSKEEDLEGGVESEVDEEDVDMSAQGAETF